MTENTFTEAPDEPAANRKPLFLAGGAAGLLVLAGGGWFLLHGHGSSSDDAFVVPHHTVVSKTAAKPAAGAKTVTSKSATRVTLPAATKVKIGRDPFAALYIVPVAAAPTGTTSAGATSATPTPTAAPQSGTATGAPYTLTLTKVTSNPGGAKLFTFTYGKTTKTVLPAQRFGSYGELVVLTYVKNSKGAVTGVVLQVGDDNPITVPVGGKVSVQ